MKQARQVLLSLLLLVPLGIAAGAGMIKADDTDTGGNPLPAPGEECE